MAAKNLYEHVLRENLDLDRWYDDKVVGSVGFS